MMNKRIPSFEAGRLLALLAVIALHSQIFMRAPLIFGEPVLGIAINQLTRFAVPLFFIMAGYFYYPKLMKNESKEDALCRYINPLIFMWLSWCIIFLIIPLNLKTFINEGYLAERLNFYNNLLIDPINSLLQGSVVHLWYIPALVCAISIITFLHVYKLERFLLPVAAMLFIYGCAAGSYVPITAFEAPFLTRNGPFFSTLLVAIGFEIRRRDVSLNKQQSLLLALGGFILFICEANFLFFSADGAFYHDFLFGSPLWAMGIFLFLKGTPTFGENLHYTSFHKDFLGVYLCHFLIVIYFFNIVFLFEVNPLISSFIAVPLCFAVSLLVVKMLRKLPFGYILVR